MVELEIDRLEEHVRNQCSLLSLGRDLVGLESLVDGRRRASCIGALIRSYGAIT